MRSTKLSSAVGGLVAVVIVAAGCGATPQSSASPVAPSSATGDESPASPVTISYQTHSNAPADELNAELIAEFEAAHPGVTVEFTSVPYENFEPGLLSGFVAGSGPDLFWIGDWAVPQFHAAGVLAAFDPDAYGMTQEAFVGQYEPDSALDAYRIDGDLITAGISEYNVISMLYNRAHFTEAGIPSPSADEPLTMEAFADIASRLARFEDGTRVRQGWAYYDKIDIWTVLTLQPMLVQLGGQLIDESGKARFDTPEMRQSMSFLRDMRLKHDAYDPAFTTDVLADFANGRMSMAFLGPWAPSVIAGVEGADPGLDIGVAPMPVFDGRERATSQYSWSWQVNSKAPAERQEWAWKLAAFLGSQSQRWFDQTGFIQPTNTTLDTGQTVLEYIRGAQPSVAVFEGDFEYGVPQFRSTSYNEISKLWTQAASLIVAGEDIDQALREAQAAADGITP